MRKLPQLVPISYRDADNGISLKCYADTIVYLRENNKRILTAVRFGGYPEQVRGMSDAIYGGISVETESNTVVFPEQPLLLLMYQEGLRLYRNIYMNNHRPQLLYLLSYPIILQHFHQSYI